MKFSIENAQSGFSDSLLENLCARPRRKDLGFAPWATWESENSSFGRAFRTWTSYPKFLPLFVVSDHGVHWESRCWENEIQSKFNNFFTWNIKKSINMTQLHGKKAWHVPHPWVNYRRKLIGDPPENRTGTLVYFPHSNNTTSPLFDNLDEYIEGLKLLDSRFQPIVLCLMSHDVEKGLHKRLKEFGLPIVTAGNSSSVNFIDNFYGLLYQFRYATSPSSIPLGSHVYYILESGVPFFLFGDGVKYQINNSISVSNGIQDLYEYGDQDDVNSMEELKSLLLIPNDVVTEEQKLRVSEYLGLNASTSSSEAARVLWRSLFFNLGDLLLLYLREVQTYGRVIFDKHGL